MPRIMKWQQRLLRLCDWEQYQDENGTPWFHCVSTDASAWVPPWDSIIDQIELNMHIIRGSGGPSSGFHRSVLVADPTGGVSSSSNSGSTVHAPAVLAGLGDAPPPPPPGHAPQFQLRAPPPPPVRAPPGAPAPPVGLPLAPCMQTPQLLLQPCRHPPCFDYHDQTWSKRTPLCAPMQPTEWLQPMLSSMGNTLFSDDSTGWDTGPKAQQGWYVMETAQRAGSMSFWWHKTAGKYFTYVCWCNGCDATVCCDIDTSTTNEEKQEMRCKWNSFLRVPFTRPGTMLDGGVPK